MNYKHIIFIFLFYGLSQSTIIRSGDVLDIKVLSHPEFSGYYKVTEKGTIDYPLIAEETIVNNTTLELMNNLTLRLARHIENPLVLISITERPEITVNVLGHVLKPGPVEIFQGASIQEAIIKAGGVIEEYANLSKVKIIHKETPDDPLIYDLEKFLKDGNIDKMPPLGANDIIIVLGHKLPQKVKIIGAVQKPGIFSVEDTMNVFEAIYLAGGPSEKADLRRVRILESNGKNNLVENVVNVQDFIDDGNLDNIPKVYAGDVVIVYTRWFDWKTFMTILNNVLLFFITIQSFTELVKK